MKLVMRSSLKEQEHRANRVLPPSPSPSPSHLFLPSFCPGFFCLSILLSCQSPSLTSFVRCSISFDYTLLLSSHIPFPQSLLPYPSSSLILTDRWSPRLLPPPRIPQTVYSLSMIMNGGSRQSERLGPNVMRSRCPPPARDTAVLTERLQPGVDDCDNLRLPFVDDSKNFRLPSGPDSVHLYNDAIMKVMLTSPIPPGKLFQSFSPTTPPSRPRPQKL
ncbi:unnamed protein product [Pleuronectes platessa]|uniref:Uncharacterized protein n=1 Tax=Pleuronectes platessa TaxID=8262 RepID=A0A9N7UMZ4_PLEPL|nr:unnamed protein product [Pleuronectes platessa]